MTIPKDFVPYDDAIPVLSSLHKQGYILGVLSNLRRDMRQLCENMRFSPYLDFYISPAEAGEEKPHATMFKMAFEADVSRRRRVRPRGRSVPFRCLGGQGSWNARGVDRPGRLAERRGRLSQDFQPGRAATAIGGRPPVAFSAPQDVTVVGSARSQAPDRRHKMPDSSHTHENGHDPVRVVVWYDYI